MSKRPYTPESITELINSKKQEYETISTIIWDLTDLIEKYKKNQTSILKEKKLLCNKANHILSNERENGPYGETYKVCNICNLEF